MSEVGHLSSGWNNRCAQEVFNLASVSQISSIFLSSTLSTPLPFPMCPCGQKVLSYCKNCRPTETRSRKGGWVMQFFSWAHYHIQQCRGCSIREKKWELKPEMSVTPLKECEMGTGYLCAFSFPFWMLTFYFLTPSFPFLLFCHQTLKFLFLKISHNW